MSKSQPARTWPHATAWRSACRPAAASLGVRRWPGIDLFRPSAEIRSPQDEACRALGSVRCVRMSCIELALRWRRLTAEPPKGPALCTPGSALPASCPRLAIWRTSVHQVGRNGETTPQRSFGFVVGMTSLKTRSHPGNLPGIQVLGASTDDHPGGRWPMAGVSDTAHFGGTRREPLDECSAGSR